MLPCPNDLPISCTHIPFTCAYLSNTPGATKPCALAYLPYSSHLCLNVTCFMLTWPHETLLIYLAYSSHLYSPVSGRDGVMLPEFTHVVKFCVSHLPALSHLLTSFISLALPTCLISSAYLLDSSTYLSYSSHLPTYLTHLTCIPILIIRPAHLSFSYLLTCRSQIACLSPLLIPSPYLTHSLHLPTLLILFTHLCLGKLEMLSGFTHVV